MFGKKPKVAAITPLKGSFPTPEFKSKGIHLGKTKGAFGGGPSGSMKKQRKAWA